MALVIPPVAVTCLLAVVLIPAAFAPEYGPGSGVLTGIVAKCTLAEDKAADEPPDTSRFIAVAVQTMGGQTVMSRNLPLTTSGARYWVRLPAGTYWINVDPGSSAGVGVPEYVSADQSTEEDFSDSNSGIGCMW